MNPNDPVSREASRAIAHLNADHADALLDMARALGGCPEATSASCLDADTTALTLEVKTPSDTLTVRIPYGEPITDAAGLRKATVRLAHRARAALTDPSDQGARRFGPRDARAPVGPSSKPPIRYR